MLAVVREAALVERLPDDLDLLFEELAVGVLVHDGRAEDLHLAGVVAAATPKRTRPSVSQSEVA